MSETLLTLLLRLSEADTPFLLPGRLASPHLGSAFDSLLVAGVLEQLPPFSAWPPCDDCTCGMGQRPVMRRGDSLVAECPLDPASDVVLSEADVEVYAIHVRRLVLQATDSSATELFTPGLWRLANLPDHTAVFLTLSRRIADDPATPSALRGYACGGEIVFVAPHGAEAARRTFAGAPDIRLVPVSDALALTESGAVRLESTALSVPRRSTRLLVDLDAGTVEVDGVEQHVPVQPYQLLRLLLAAFPKRKWVSAAEISADLGREARDLVRDLKDALADGRDDADVIRGWIQNKLSPSRYRLELSPKAVTVLGDPR